MTRCFKSCARRAWVACLVAALWFVPAQPADAQTKPAQGTTPGSAYTLHAYTDLLELPTLVLTPLHGNYVGLTNENFTMSIGEGPTFHPASVRRQGNDPITLAILFDLTTDDNSMFTSFAKAMFAKPMLKPAADLLSARDHISVYAYDCKLVRTTED